MKSLHIFSSFLAIGIAFIGSEALAQSQAKPVAPKPIAAPNAATPAPVQPPTAPAPAPAPLVQRTEVILADNWVITCVETDKPATKRRCSAELKIIQTVENQNRVVFSWVLAKQDNNMVALLSVPPNVLIGPGLQFKLGDKEMKRTSYLLCVPDRCEASVAMDDAFIGTVQGATTIDIMSVAANGANLKFSVNLKGFDVAMSEVRK